MNFPNPPTTKNNISFYKVGSDNSSKIDESLILTAGSHINMSLDNRNSQSGPYSSGPINNFTSFRSNKNTGDTN